MINVFQPSVGAGELAAVGEIFDSGWVGRGKRTAEFEKAFASHLGVGPANVTSMSCCTEALFMAMTLTGIGPGDDVVLPSVSFVGAGNAVAAHGARPVFCDVDPRTLNPTADDVARAFGPSTRAVLLLHYGGHPGEVAEIARLCAERGVLLIEDAANAIASTVDGRACGTLGDFGVWSFDHGKIAVAVDGGVLYARDPELVRRATRLAYFGLAEPTGHQRAARSASRWWEIEVESFSRRSVLNDVLAAIGTVQLRRLPEFLARRAEIVARYGAGLAGVPGLVLPPPVPRGHRTSHYFYWVQLDPRVRDDVAEDLYRAGVYTTFRYPPLHHVPLYGSDAVLPGADLAAARTLNLPLHQSLSDDDVDLVVRELKASLARRAEAVLSP